MISILFSRIGGVIVSVLLSSAVDHGFEPRSGQTKDYKIGICCLSAKHATLRRKSKDWLAWNEDNVSEWGDMSICRLLFRWASTIKIAELGLANNHSITQFVFCLLSRINLFLLFCMGIPDYFWRWLKLFYCIMILDTFWANTEDYQTKTLIVCSAMVWAHMITMSSIEV
jgi:hypothetical protein